MQKRKDVSKFKGSALIDDEGDSGDSLPNFAEVTDVCRKLAGGVRNRQVATRDFLTAMPEAATFKLSLLPLVECAGAFELFFFVCL